MKKILVILLAFVALSATAQNAKKHYKTAEKLFTDQLYEEALGELMQAIQLENGYVEAYVLRGKVYESKNQLDKATEDFEKAAELDPRSAENLLNAGKANYRIQNYIKALKYLNEAVLIDDKNFQALQFKSFTHIKLEEYPEAIVAIDKAIKINDTYLCYYSRAVANDSLKKYPLAVADYLKAIEKNSTYSKAYFALSIAYLNSGDITNALNYANLGVEKFSDEPKAYEVRSYIFHQKGSLAEAINDLSKLATLKQNDSYALCHRGKYYFEYGQFQNAKGDFSQILAQSDSNYPAAYWRGRCNEEMLEAKLAVADYTLFLAMQKRLNTPSSLIQDAKDRIYNLNRETVAPVVVIDTPIVIDNQYLGILHNADRITIKGSIKDSSDISKLTINDKEIIVNSNKEFEYNLSIVDLKTISIATSDIYNNKTTVDFGLKNVETDKPTVRVTNPYASDNNEIYLDTDDNNLFIEGIISDASNIKDIFVDNIRASFNDTELNPKFTASINIMNKKSITIKAVDIFNNTAKTTFTLNREGAIISQSNPMGKTWVVFIENSNYETFASLEGPTKDVSTMKAALNGYEIHNFIHKKDMTKKEMERFFSIELRDQVKKNNVNSLLVWYAGHGKYINETGYWIPVDATRDDEFTYFNINALKAGMQAYSNVITHTLVITDACESGPSFYQAMRADNAIRSCDDVSATKFKSSQVFSSAGYELAADDSKFTKTFAKSLQFNENSCIPIESIVIKVTEAVTTNNQKPQFGKIAGFEDENGTFFFIKK